MKKFTKALMGFDRAMTAVENALGIVLLAGMVLSIFLQVVMRFVFNNALSWSEELARYLMIWCTAFGISAGIRFGTHIGIQAIVDAIPAKAAGVVRFLCELLTLLICVFLAYTAILFVQSAWISHQLAPCLQIPMFYIYLALPVAFIFCTVRQLQVIVMQFLHIDTRPGKEEVAL